MMLHFRPEYVKQILSGKKRMTVRLGVRNVRPGMIIILAAGGKPFARARVVSVRRKRVRDITDEEVKKEGYSDFTEFYAALRSLYPGISLDDEVTIIEWRLI